MRTCIMAEKITLALDRYERHFPFFDGTLDIPAGLSLKVLQAGETNPERDGAHRHKRMLNEHEFDAAEVSFSSYLMAKARGLPFTAIPAFPRRLFSQTQMYVRTESPIEHPAALAGKRIGLQSFQTTLAVLAKGDLAHEYGVDLRSVHWIARANETVAFEPPAGWTIETVAADADLSAMLAEGEMDALFLSRVPDALGEGTVRRLFRDPRGACAEFHGRNGFFPIMHVIAIAEDAVAANGALPRQLLDLYAEADALTAQYLDDPGWSRLAWARIAREEQEAALVGNLWPTGIAANLANIDRFAGYSHDQGLTDRVLSAADLFHPSVLES
jgi:4,5-dihydroxyphthalate decarboxylase